MKRLKNRDDFSESVKRILQERVGNHCSNPECRKATSGPHSDPGKVVRLGVAAHITAAAPKGPRRNDNFSKKERGGIENGIWLCQKCAKLIDADPDKYPISKLLEWKQIAEKKAEDELTSRPGEEITWDAANTLLSGSRSYYEALRGPNGRFRYLKISDILFTGAETKWLETCVELDEKSQDLFEKRSRHPQKLLINQKFYGGSGPAARGADKSFSKEPPGCRRHSIIEVLPILWESEVKHAVIVGEGGMGKTVSLIQWWENLLGSEEKLKPVPVFIALNEFNQVSEEKREGFILETIRKNYGLGKITLDQIESLMKIPLQQGEEFIPSMVLLLDGFNEITAEKRQLLVELNRLAEQFPGVQVIMTSRYDMRGNFNWSHWRPVRLKELEDGQVEMYLREHGMTGTVVSGKGRLGNLIKNPMMLTLYAASCEVREKHRDSRFCSFKDRVESPGELLWNFIEAQVALLPDRVGPEERIKTNYHEKDDFMIA